MLPVEDISDNQLRVNRRAEYPPWVFYAACVVMGSLALLLVLPHLGDELWHDEVYTLTRFSSNGFLYPFTDYHAPNNHVLFSAVLAVWREFFGEQEICLRLLPLLFFLASLIVFMAAAKRLADTNAAIVTGLLFATSHVILNFAVQLRGYSFSWLPIAVGLFVLPKFLAAGGGWKSGLVYVISAAIAIGILPTNLLVFIIFSLWSAGVVWLSSGQDRKALFRKWTVITLAPLAGIVFYLDILKQLLKGAGQDWHAPSFGDVAYDYALHTNVDFFWLLPIVLLGLMGLVRKARTAKGILSSRSLLVFGGCVLLVPFVVYSMLPHVPFSRNLVPIIPLYYVFLAVLCSTALQSTFKIVPAMAKIVMVGIVAIHIAVTAHREYLDSGYVARNRDSFMPQNLYDQYFHHDYHVSKTATFMRELAVSGPSFFVSDHSDFPALSYAVLKLYPQGLGAELVYWDDQDLQQQSKDHIRDKTIYVVTGSPQQANVILKRLGLEAGHLKEIRRAGFFSIYVVSPGA